jgi:diguanylate cyclase (GGDEF)-like protein/PAS domain S-box-containing protein
MPDRERLLALLHHVSETITVGAADGTILWASGNPGGTLGYPDEYWLGKTIFDVIHPDDLDRILAWRDELLGHPEREVHGEFRVRGADGGWHDVEGVGVNRLDDPLIGGLVVTTRNITSRKRAERKLAIQAAVLERIAVGAPLAGTLAEIDAFAAEFGDVEVGEHLRSIATEQASNTERLANLAMHDGLTGLPNRLLLRDRLVGALARVERLGGHVAVLFVDLDRFKMVNDGLGHGAGDQLLASAARRLERGVRPIDTVARFGGDEFVVVCEGVEGDEHALLVAERIARVFGEAFHVRGQDVVLTCSVGVALTADTDTDPDALVRDADAAMYRAKEGGGARVEVFDREMHESVAARLHVEAELRRGVAEGQLLAHFQPIVDVPSGRTVSTEVLARWQHPERGLLLPDLFLPLAEESSLVVALEEEVRRLALRDAASWVDRDVWLTLNVSARHLASPAFVERLVADVDARGWRCDRLTLELTERVLLSDHAMVRTSLHALRELGVRLVIDDFGTGYSSLGELHRFELDGVKIDRSFIADVDRSERDATLVRAIVGMAEALGVTCVAEGVESASQRDALLDLGCRLQQGHLFSRPVAAPELVRLLPAAVRV